MFQKHRRTRSSSCHQSSHQFAFRRSMMRRTQSRCAVRLNDFHSCAEASDSWIDCWSSGGSVGAPSGKDGVGSMEASASWAARRTTASLFRLMKFRKEIIRNRLCGILARRQMGWEREVFFVPPRTANEGIHLRSLTDVCGPTMTSSVFAYSAIVQSRGILSQRDYCRSLIWWFYHSVKKKTKHESRLESKDCRLRLVDHTNCVTFECWSAPPFRIICDNLRSLLEIPSQRSP